MADNPNNRDTVGRSLPNGAQNSHSLREDDGNELENESRKSRDRLLLESMSRAHVRSSAQRKVTTGPLRNAAARKKESKGGQVGGQVELARPAT